MRIRFLLLFAALVSWAQATSVVPPDFSELVAEADAIYRGRVSDVQARRVARADGGGVIKTFVTIVIEKVLKGPEQAAVTLEFLGGTVGDEAMEVSGMPTFATGDRGIVFVQKNGQQFCPLVRMGHGTYPIARDDASGAEYVARKNGAPLIDVSEVQQPLSDRPPTAASRNASSALSPAAFEARISGEIQRAAAAPQAK
jgi:hypothetical protein